MEEQQNKSGTSYGNIFKTTFLFGFVQVFKAIISIVKNKLVAMLIGPEGMGLLGIYNSTMVLLQTGAGLGINQSAVRDIAEANGEGNKNRISRIIYVTNKVVLFTGALGCFITLILSYWLSEWTLHSSQYTTAYCILSIAVACNIMNDGKQAILKGKRQLLSLAKASIIGTIVGLVTAIPLYYFFGMDGIVPEILIASILALLTSQYFVKKIEVDQVNLPLQEIANEAKSMIKVGVALMFVAFIQIIVTVSINSYMLSKGGLADVGCFNAGFTILSSYFGVVITALMTDYYPRISSVNSDNEKLQDELNKQAKVSLVLCCPMFVFFMVYSSFLIQLLYTDEFLPAADYVLFGIYWTLITICSNQVDLILVAKGRIKIFTGIAILIRTTQLLLCIFLYNKLGLLGMGISYAILGIMHMTIMTIVVYRNYNIRFDRTFLKLAGIVLFFSIIASILSTMDNKVVSYSIGGFLSLASVYFSFYTSKRVLKIDFVLFIKSKIAK